MNKALRLLCLSTVVSVGGFAGVQPLSVTVMERQGLEPTLIGLLSSLIFCGILILAPFQPALATRFGALRTYQVGKALAVCGFGGCAWAVSPAGWAIAFVLLGLGAALTWPLTDSLIATEAPVARKGEWLSRFQAAMGVAFAMGPFLAAIFAQWPRAVFLGAAAVAILSSLPLLRYHLPAPIEERDEDVSFLTIRRSAGGLALAAFLGGLFENGTHTAGTLIALAEGWSGHAAVSLAGVMAAGSYFVQRPLGRLADRSGSGGILRWALAVLAVSLGALPWAEGRPWLLWALALIWGAASGCLYTLAMTGTAQQLPVRHIAAATTVMVLGYTVGSALGPILGGWAVDEASLKGVSWIFGILATVGWGVSYLSKPNRGLPSMGTRSDPR